MLPDIMMGSWEFEAAFCVGRSRGCEVSISTSEETRTVSKRHVGIVPLTETLTSSGRGKRRWLIYDLETMNGTAVNGVDLPKGGNRELHHGDEVVLASAMRQCVRLLVQFPDQEHSCIVVKALARANVPLLAPLHRRTTTPRPSPAHRSPRRVAMTNTPVAAATGFGRSAATFAGSPAIARTGCRSLVGTPGSADGNMMTPPPHSLPQKRSRSSPQRTPAENENVEKNTQQETPNSQQRKRSRRGGAIEEEAAVIDGDSLSAKRAQEHEKEERERLMVCPVCLEYFHGSATLPCSHTFCGYCISNWFRTSLSCPECRDVVKTVPVRNRALDELVERLVGQTDAYKSHICRRAQMQRRSVGTRGHDHGGRYEDSSEGAARGVSSLQLTSNSIPEPRMRSSVFTRWSVEEKLAFSAYINNQFGEARVATCRKIGLTESAVDRSNMTNLLVAAQNLLLDCGGLRLVGDGCCQRLKIFLFFG
jgi:hypothetical protein